MRQGSADLVSDDHFRVSLHFHINDRAPEPHPFALVPGHGSIIQKTADLHERPFASAASPVRRAGGRRRRAGNDDKSPFKHYLKSPVSHNEATKNLNNACVWEGGNKVTSCPPGAPRSILGGPLVAGLPCSRFGKRPSNQPEHDPGGSLKDSGHQGRSLKYIWESMDSTTAPRPCIPHSCLSNACSNNQHPGLYYEDPPMLQ